MKIWRFFKGAVALYLIYALVGAALLPALPKKVSEKTKKEFSMDHYLGKWQGPDRVLLVEDPARGFDIRIALISEAKKTLDISTHCVEWGTTAEYFFAALLDAADRGVQPHGQRRHDRRHARPKRHSLCAGAASEHHLL